MSKIQIRRGTKVQLDPLTSGYYLDIGELGFTTDTEEVYVGTGLTSNTKHLVGKVMVDTFANRPTAGISGRMFHATDTDVTYVDDGSSWIDVSSGIATIDDVDDGTTYVRTKAGAVDATGSGGYITQLTDNAGANPLTKANIETHIGTLGNASAELAKHRVINDAGTAVTELWSASKITDEIANVVSGIDPQESVISQSDLTSTVTPSTGHRYINTTTGTAADGGGTVTINNIYEWNGTTWDETVVSEGMHTWDETLDASYVYNGTAWVKFGTTVTHNNLAGLNVGDYKHLTAAEKSTLDALETNVPTELSIGTRAATTMAITSDGGADDVVLPAANTSQAGLMTDAQFDKLALIEDSANDYTHPNHTGDVSSTGDGATVIGAGKVTLAMQADMATDSFVGRDTIGSGAPEVLSIADAKALLAIVENVSTSLSFGTITGTTVPINSDGSSPDITLLAADTDDAGLMTATQFDAMAVLTGGTSSDADALHTHDIHDGGTFV